MRLADLAPDDPRLLADVLPVLAELYPQLAPDVLANVYTEGHPQGLRFTAAYDEHNRCVGVAGWRIIATTMSIRKLYVDDLVTTAAHRSRGIGKALLSELAQRARVAGCSMLDLDCRLTRHDAHRFYLREGMQIDAFHFELSLT